MNKHSLKNHKVNKIYILCDLYFISYSIEIGNYIFIFVRSIYGSYVPLHLRMQPVCACFLTKVFSLTFSFIIMADEQDATLEQFFEELPISVQQIIRPLYSKKQSLKPKRNIGKNWVKK